MSASKPRLQQICGVPRTCGVLALGAALAGGCYSGLDGGAVSGADGGSASSDGGGSDGGDDGADDGGVMSCDEPSVGGSPLRRLTQLEYDNTVRDLLDLDLGLAQDRFPSDEQSGGFAANAVAPVSATQLDEYSKAAEDLADMVAVDFDTTLGCDVSQTACAEGFARDFGLRAFRRPLTTEEIAEYVALYESGRTQWDGATGLRLVVQAMLMSPHFLYHIEVLPPDVDETDVVPLQPYELASRLSYFVWASMPDDALFAAAESGALLEREELETQVRRMLDDPRAADAIASFHQQWMHIDEVGELVKDTDMFPTWSAELGEAMQDETLAFVDEVVRRGDGKLQTLLTADWSFANAELAALYGVAPPAEDFGEVALDPEQRAGILTQAAFLASKAHAAENSWVHRGKFVRENLLCEQLPAPPPGVEVNDPNDPGRLENPECAGCHIMMDPIGVGFDNYDPIGAFATQDGAGDPIDAAGEVVGVPEIGEFDGAVGLAHALAQSPKVHACVAKQWFRFASRRIDTDEDACALTQIEAAFEASGQDVRELIVAVVMSEAFLNRKAAAQ